MSPFEVIRPTPRRSATTGPGNVSHSSTSSTLEPFPLLSHSQHARLDRIISALDPDAKTWAEFKQKKEEIEGQTAAETNTDDDGNDEEDIFPISLKLVFQEGVTWKDKWARVQRERLDATPNKQTRSSAAGLEVLRAKMDRVTVADDAEEQEMSTRRRRMTPRTPSADPTSRSSTTVPALPLPARPRSTPATLPRPTRSAVTIQQREQPTAREFLVRKTEPGHSSSSDDYAGVPSLQALAIARRNRRIEATKERERVDAKQEEEAEMTPKPRRSVPPIQSTPPPREPAKHPLLDRRLAELGLAPPPPDSSPLPLPLPQSQFSVPPLVPSQARKTVQATQSGDRLRSPSPRPLNLPTPPRPPTRDLVALENTAVEFRRLHLLSSHFEPWLSLSRFQLARLSSVDEARETWLLRCAVQDWSRLASRLRQLRDRESEWRVRGEEQSRGRKRDKSLKKGVWNRWRERVREKVEEKIEEEKKEKKRVREAELREARDRVVERRKEGLVRRSLKAWKEKLTERKAFKFRLKFLALHSLRRWESKLEKKREHVDMLEGVADEVWTGSERDKFGRAFGEWRRRMRMRVAERAVTGRSEEGIKRRVTNLWVDKTRNGIHQRQLEYKAIQVDARRLASTKLANWRSRYAQTRLLTEQASQLSASFSRRLIQRSIKDWSLHLRADRFYRLRTRSVTDECLTKWVERLDHLQIDLEGRALKMIESKNVQLVAVTFKGWKEATLHRRRLLQVAEAVSRKKTLTRSISKWGTRVKEDELQARKAVVVREFFVQRSAWRRWVDRGEQRKQERWFEARIKLRKREALAFWAARARQAQEDRNLVEIVQRRNRKRTLQERLGIWKEQVIVRKELERESTILYESRLAESQFRRWIAKTVSFADQLGRADEFRSLKLEELRDSTFHRWLSSTRRSVTLKVTLARRLEKRKIDSLQSAFGAWREKRLARFEVGIKDRIARQTRKSVLEKWKSETTTLTALKVYRSNLLGRTLATWKRWTPSIDLVKQAVHHDTDTLTHCTVQRWSLKTSYRRAFRNTSGRLSAPRSLASPTSRSSQSSPRRLPEGQSPLSPSVRTRIDASTTSSPSSRFGSPSPSYPSAAVSTVATTAPPSFASLGGNIDCAPTSSPRSNKPSSSLLTTNPRPSHRPRLSAEYVAPTPLRHQRRRSSIASLGARSAPATAVAVESESSDTEEELGLAAERRIARSEGGGDSREREKRDVRKGYEALRERLRIAATGRQSK